MNQLKDDQEECETRLEKERDIYASNMFDLLAEEDNITSYVVNYVKCESSTIKSLMKLTLRCLFTDQQLYYKSALKEIESLMSDMNSLISEFHISFVIELLVHIKRWKALVSNVTVLGAKTTVLFMVRLKL